MSQKAQVTTFSSSQLCIEAAISRGQLRLYEREGLIHEPQRTPGGYRRYTDDDVMRLRAIKGLKDVGMTLSEIRELLCERDQEGLDFDQLKRKAEGLLAKTDDRIARLEAIRNYLRKFASSDRAIMEEPECRFLTGFLSSVGKR